MNVVAESFAMVVRTAENVGEGMDWYWILFIVLGVILTLVFAISFVVIYQMTRGKRVTLQDHFDYCQKYGYPFYFPNMKTEPMNFTMSDGYLIHGEWIDVPNSKGVVICAHGHMARRDSSRKYADFFNELGYTAIIYDHRGHGDNDRTFVSMGYRESKDLSEVISQVRQKIGDDVLLGIHGESMGGATVLLTMQYQPKVDFVIDDCGYATLKKIIKDLAVKSYHLPFFLFYLPLDFWMRLLCGFSIRDVQPMKAIQKSNVPIMFIHGTKDTYVFPDNAQLLYNSYQGKKKLVFVEGAKHALSIYTNRELYKNSVNEFLDGCEKNG